MGNFILRAILIFVGCFICVYWTLTGFQPTQNWIPIVVFCLSGGILFDWVGKVFKGKNGNGKDKE